MKKLYLSLLFALLIGFSWGQSGIGIAKTGNLLSDTARLGYDSLITRVWVKNYGPQPTGQFTCQLNYAILDTSGMPSVYASDTFNINLNVNDSTYISNSRVCPSQGVKSGINIIVIWPAAPQNSLIQTNDTLYHPILLLDHVGIARVDFDKLIKVYPNPTTDMVTINAPDKNIKVSLVALYDQAGRLIGEWSNGMCTIDCSSLPRGMYLFKVYTSGNAKPSVFQVLKE